MSILAAINRTMAEALPAAAAASGGKAPPTDRHAFPQTTPTHTQTAMLIAYVVIIVYWLLNFLATRCGIRMFRLPSLDGNGGKESSPVAAKRESGTNRMTFLSAKYEKAALVEGENSTEEGNTVIEVEAGLKNGGPTEDIRPIEIVPKPAASPFDIDTETLLRSLLLFGVIMIFFYLCDYAKVFPQGDRVYTRDTFLFLVFLLFLVGGAFTLKPCDPKILNRDQTEEWKGWMQVMFVWYHYWAAKEWYNWIRVYIACYVWMTGFGNFSFFWIRKDFSMWRCAKMLFRLNFLVTFVVLVTDNDYMLYYICAMHTYWFFTVYAFMRVLNSWNTDSKRMAVKFLAYAAFNFLIFDVPGMSDIVFYPFKFVLGLEDKTGNIMHEWSFRAGLDHWACFVGMLCAYNYPTYEALHAWLDSKSHSANEQSKKLFIRVGLGVTATVVGVIWYFTFMQEEKFGYNAKHPYSSMIPIMCFCVLRNIHPTLRKYHIHMFAWLGKITLETYLSQLHVYLLSNARSLLVYLPNMPLLNFALATIVYLSLSNCLFSVTTDVSNFLLPKDTRKMFTNLLTMLILGIVSTALAFAIDIL